MSKPKPTQAAELVVRGSPLLKPGVEDYPDHLHGAVATVQLPSEDVAPFLERGAIYVARVHDNCPINDLFDGDYVVIECLENPRLLMFDNPNEPDGYFKKMPHCKGILLGKIPPGSFIISNS